jgi:Uma2 family endonuclease
MAVQTALSLDEYLRTAYEHDPEFVHGELVERSMPNINHARIQMILGAIFVPLRRTHRLVVFGELRVQIAPEIVRLPDVCVYDGEPDEELPTKPPLVAIEILSPDDRYTTVLTKCREYRDWGVRHIWIIDPAQRLFQAFDGLDLRTVPHLDLPEADLTITPAEVFE